MVLSILQVLYRITTGHTAKYAESVEDNEDIDPFQPDEDEEKMSIATSIFNLNGKPFSAVHRQALPKYFAEPQEL